MKQKKLRDLIVNYSENGRDINSDSGVPVIFVHGLAEDHKIWSRQQIEFSEMHTYAYDLRGHGETTAGDCNGSLEQLGRDLLAFIEGVSGPAVVVGFSLGGAIALWAAAERNDLVLKTIVLGTSSVVGRAAVDFYEQRINLAEQPNSIEFKNAIKSDTESGLYREHADSNLIVDARISAIGNGIGYRNACRAMIKLNSDPLTEKLKNISGQVIVVGADNDGFCPLKAASIILDSLSSAIYANIPNAGHLMNIDNPDAVSNTLHLFLT